MKTLSRTQSLVVAALAAATLSVPAVANAGNYSSSYSYADCKRSDKDNQIVGGLLGAVAGGVIGSQVSGSGARTEGSVLGAAIGAAAGAGIADDRRNCRDEHGIVRTNGYYQTGSSYHGGNYGTSHRTTSRTYYPSSHRTYGSTSRRHYPSSNYGYGSSNYGYGSGYYSGNEVERIKRQIQRLRQERRDLEARNHYDRSPWVDRRIREIGREIRWLKEEKRRAKKQANRHYHGSNVCYEYH